MPDWARLTIAGFRHLSNGSDGQAAFAWLRAADFYAESRDDDPRYATAHNNAGVAYSLLGRNDDAQVEFDIAQRNWTHALATVPSLDVPIGSGSSSFHFRLVSTSLDAFANVHRRKYDARCRTSIAITKFNSASANAKQFSDEQIRIQAQKLRSLTTDTYGQSSPESRLLSAIAERKQFLDASLHRDKVARIEHKFVQSPDRDDDPCFCIEIATELMAISPNRDLSKIAADRTETSSLSITTES
jgi:hypothetical protein